jgi:serine/threonine protein kinase
LAEQPPHPRKPWAAIFPDASVKAVDLLDRMLQFHPAKRISVEDAIGHPYFDSVRGCVSLTCAAVLRWTAIAFH